MSLKTVDDESGGNSEKDWEIFEILCKNMEPPPCVPVGHSTEDHLTHSLDLATTLRSELAALTYKRDRLIHELGETKNVLCAKDNECEALRAQSARQSSLINSLQQRLQTAEGREKNLLARTETTTNTLQRDKRCIEEKNKELCSRVRRMECDLSNEENHSEQLRLQLQDLVRKLCLCLGIDVCESAHLTPDTVLGKAEEVVAELHRLRKKLASNCESLTTCEAELLNLRGTSTAEKSRLHSQIESLQTLTQGLETRCKQTERDLQMTRDRLAECEVNGDKLREELRGFESRCCRLQGSLDRLQNDRLQFLRNIASIIGVPEPCETLIKDKVRDMTNDNQTMHNQIVHIREQLNLESIRNRELQETSSCRLRAEESQKCSLEERLEKTNHELQHFKADHFTLSEYLVKLSRALCWSECSEPPHPGSDTAILAETLLERAERLASHHDHHPHNGSGMCEKNMWSGGGNDHSHHHHLHLPKLRRERSCHDIPLKENIAGTTYNLQKRVRVLREQVQRRDLHLELMKRKIALLEDNAKGKAILQSERDEAMHRARRNCKQAEKSTTQLIEVKSQLAEVKTQLSEATDYKITALERGRKIDELQSKLLHLENEREHLAMQLSSCKTRVRSAVESSTERKARDDHTIIHLRDELTRVKTSLADVNHRLSQLSAFKGSVARLLHVHDMPDSDLLHRLQSVCHAHQDFTLLSRRYESPVVDHCQRFEELNTPTCRPLSSTSPLHMRRYIDSGFNDHDHHYDDDYDLKKF